MSEPIDSESVYVMNSLAKFINEALNGVSPQFKKFGFTLLVFKFGDNVKVNYISSAKRKAMIDTLKSVIARLEAEDSRNSRVM